MASSGSPKKNTANSFAIHLSSQSDPTQFQANATIAAGDAKISIDNGAYANLTNLPSVSPAGSKPDVTAYV